MIKWLGNKIPKKKKISKYLHKIQKNKRKKSQ